MKRIIFALVLLPVVTVLFSCAGGVYINDTTAAYTWQEDTTEAYVNLEGAMSGDFIYSLYSDNTLEITSYEGSEKSVTVPAEISNRPVFKIGEEAFCYNSTLEVVTISSGISEVGKGAFYSCSALMKVVIPDTVTNLDEGVFKNCTALTELVIPESVAFIGDSAFSGCTSLTKIYFSGTNENWRDIDIGEGNDVLTAAVIVFDYSLE